MSTVPSPILFSYHNTTNNPSMEYLSTLVVGGTLITDSVGSSYYGFFVTPEELTSSISGVEQNITSATGFTGPQGTLGTTGSTGPQGTLGTTGSTGPQ